MKALKRLLGLGGVGGLVGGPQLRVLMVCSGNICRSPTAEGVLRVKLERAGLADRIEVDSAGTQGLHAREAPDPRAQAHARQRGYDLSRQRARQVAAEDFMRFQRILAMDDGHLQWLHDKAPPGSRAHLGLLMAHAVRHRDRDIVPDPSTDPTATSRWHWTWSRMPAMAWWSIWAANWRPPTVAVNWLVEAMHD
jgi:protein-tyrosine phosphatase